MTDMEFEGRIGETHPATREQETDATDLQPGEVQGRREGGREEAADMMRGGVSETCVRTVEETCTSTRRR